MIRINIVDIQLCSTIYFEVLQIQCQNTKLLCAKGWDEFDYFASGGVSNSAIYFQCVWNVNKRIRPKVWLLAKLVKKRTDCTTSVGGVETCIIFFYYTYLFRSFSVLLIDSRLLSKINILENDTTIDLEFFDNFDRSRYLRCISQ